MDAIVHVDVVEEPPPLAQNSVTVLISSRLRGLDYPSLAQTPIHPCPLGPLSLPFELIDAMVRLPAH